jgi:hypothetical protein
LSNCRIILNGASVKSSTLDEQHVAMHPAVGTTAPQQAVQHSTCMAAAFAPNGNHEYSCKTPLQPLPPAAAAAAANAAAVAAIYLRI